jgi:hypothetical protein
MTAPSNRPPLRNRLIAMRRQLLDAMAAASELWRPLRTRHAHAHVGDPVHG